MKQLLILIPLILLFSPVIGHSSKYKYVSQCVLQIMEERKMTGKNMLEVVKEEYERILGNSENKGEGIKEFLYLSFRNGELSLYDEKLEGVESEKTIDAWKYEGEIKNELPNGQGIFTTSDGSRYAVEYKTGIIYVQGTDTSPSGEKYVGEWKNGKPWNITGYDKKVNIVNG